jgi:hypothetical protein
MSVKPMYVPERAPSRAAPARLPENRPRLDLQNVVLLTALVLLSFAPVIARLGFYSDDWGFLAAAHNHEALLVPDQQARPRLLAYLPVLYALFGKTPLGYHLVQATLFAATVDLAYVVLRRFGLPIIIAFAVSAMYALSPSYSADRFWISGIQINLAMALYLGSLYAGLRAIDAERAWLAWTIASIVAMAGSLSAYELELSLFVFNIVMLWLIVRTRGNPFVRRFYVLAGSSAVVLCAAFLWKVTMTQTVRFGLQITPLHRLLRVLKACVDAVVLHFGTYGVGLPLVSLKAVRHYWDPTIGVTALLTGAVVFICLNNTFARLPGWRLRPSSLQAYLLVGLIVFALGYALPIVALDVAFPASGLANRTAIASALGISLAFVGMFALAARYATSTRQSRLVFSCLVAFCCASGMYINGVVGLAFAQATETQNRTLALVQAQYPHPAKRTTLLLDGVCPYVGPAPVFEAWWDASGALDLTYDDPSIVADIVTERTHAASTGFQIALEGESSLYSYGNVILVNLARKTVTRVTTRADALRYLQDRRREAGSACAPSEPGFGIKLF